MSHPGQRKRVADEDEDIELTGTQIEMADDSEIAPEHRLREDVGLLRNIRIRKEVAFTAHVELSWALLPQLYSHSCSSNYGPTMETQSSKSVQPQVVGAGCFDEDGEHGKMFGMQFHQWVNNTLHINMTKPDHALSK